LSSLDYTRGFSAIRQLATLKPNEASPLV